MMADAYLPPKAGFSVVGSHIETDGSYKGKVTGTLMGGILGCSPWSSPFQAACYALGLASKDISNKPSVKAGVALEGRVIEYMGKKFGADVGEFIPAEEIYAARIGDHDAWESDFDDDVFGGHVDGIVMSDDGECYILEVKTSSNMQSWENGVPKYYFWQVALYNAFVTKQDHAYVALGIMTPESLKDPESWVPSDANTALFNLPIDQEMVEETLGNVREWYDTYVAKGITPDYDPSNPKDVELFEHLVNLTMDEGHMSMLVDQLANVRDELSKEEFRLQPLKNFEENLKTKLKDYMDCHEIDEMSSEQGGYKAILTKSVRTRVDTKKLRDAGIDPEPYTITTETKSFTIKENKE